MSNSHTKRPRRSFATGSTPPTNQPHAAGLRYDGDEVPVLIRLPDLSPQALLRQPAANVSKPVSSVASTPAPTAPARKTPPTLDHPKSVQAEAPNRSESTPPPKDKPVDVETKVSQATVEPSSDERSSGDGSTKTTNTVSTAATTESSPRKRRRRNRRSRSENVAQRGQVHSASSSESRVGSRRTSETTNVDRQDRNILAFDPSPLIIVVGLLVVAGLTYVVMNGGGDEPEDSPGGWPTDTGSVAGTDESPESEANLWPSDPLPTVQDESTLAHQPAPGVEAHPHAHAPAPSAVWPTELPGQPVGYAPTTIPAGDYTYSTGQFVAPANVPDNREPNSNGPILGWPTESSTSTQPTSTSGAVNGWPEAAMASPTTDAPNDRFASQPARRAELSERVSSFPDEPAARTGRLETGSYPGRSFNTMADSGSQLNGTIEIPPARANNEYNGSNVY